MAQQDTSPELKIYIQKMIDAHEPEEAIASVIQAYARGELKLPPPALTTAKPDQIHIISPKSETEGYWGGVRNSLGFGGTVDQRTREILKQYVAGGILDLPQTAMGLGKHVFDRVGGAITEPARDLYNLPSRLSAASNTDLVGMGLKSVGEMSGVPSLYREGKDIYNTLGNVWDTAANSGTDEGGKKWGRLMGQMTLQPLVTEGAIKGANAVPARAIYREAATPIRALGEPVENAGQWIQFGAKHAPPYSIMRKTRWGGKLIGGGLEKIGELMKEAGLTQEEINAAALKDFWGDDSHGNITGPTVPKPSGPSGGSSSGGDVWGDALKKERDRRFNFDNVPENPLTTEFNKPLPGGLHPPDYEPSLPFPKEGEPAPGDLPIEGEQSGLTPEIKKITDKIKAVNISEPNARKDALLRDQGFEPVGKPDAMGRQRYERTRAADEAPITSKETAEEPLPQTISLNGLKPEDIAAIKASGRYEPGGQGADGFGQYKLKKTTGEVAKDLGKRFIKEQGGSSDWKTAYLKLRELLGRDPSAAEIEEAVGKPSFAERPDRLPLHGDEQIPSHAFQPDEGVASNREFSEEFLPGPGVSNPTDRKTINAETREAPEGRMNEIVKHYPSILDEAQAIYNETDPQKISANLARELASFQDTWAKFNEAQSNLMKNNVPIPQEIKDAYNRGFRLRDLAQAKYERAGVRAVEGQPETIADRVKGFWREDQGTFDPQQLWDNLKKMLGRDPTDAELAQAKNREPQPGETTGRVAPFEGRVRPPGATRPEDVTGGKEVPLPNVPPELGGSDPTDQTELKALADYWWNEHRLALNSGDTKALAHANDMLEKIIAKSRYPNGENTSGSDPTDPNHPFNRPLGPQNDILGVRTRTTLRPANSSDVPVQPRMGQQDLPLGPHDTMPQVDEYGIPQKRDWSQEDIFRINDEMKRANKPPSPPPSPEPQQMHIPEFGDDMIQQYLGQEDARPPEMNDINTFRPPHSPDKISFMQKLKDMLDQEYA